ncbi:hypothetical protein L2E82_19137 [Cichorium intybus]|uniref:Uncharacterized protein n=1 Tax=Cichorium intybus TaxID=13427 RepID=A0ACB9FCE8_CICIN|nr:hypothetical protein L2E82_19137 [Cichorium intybus]
MVLSFSIVSLVERRLMGGNSVKEAQENDASVKKSSQIRISSSRFSVRAKNGIWDMQRLNPLVFEQEPVVGISGIVGGSNEAKIGGRKMGMMLKKEDGEMASRPSTGDAQKLNVEADKNASKEGPQDFLHNQVIILSFHPSPLGQKDTLEKMTINLSLSLQKEVSHVNTNNIISNEDQSEEWRKLLEDADKKVMEMMRRDYSGMRKPRRKPPINNQEPRN